MTLHRVDVGTVTPQPWRNGCGETRELLTWPSAQAWGIRISVADIARDGPFSEYPGVERWFTVLEGEGVRLEFGDTGAERSVSAGDGPLRFDGARPVRCALVGGATRDLNVMVAGSRGSGECEAAVSSMPWSSRDELRAVFAQDAARLVVARRSRPLGPMSLVWSTDARGEAWRLEDAGRAWWIRYHPKGVR